MSYKNDRGETVLDEQETILVVPVDGIEVVVVGFNWNTTQKAWEYYDIFYQGECLNLGEPWGGSRPTPTEVSEFVRHYHSDLL